MTVPKTVVAENSGNRQSLNQQRFGLFASHALGSGYSDSLECKHHHGTARSPSSATLLWLLNPTGNANSKNSNRISIANSAIAAKAKKPLTPTPLPEQTQTTISSLYHQAKTWFQTLPTIGQVAVGIGTVVLSLSVLQTVMRLVTLGISLAVIAVVGYMGYRLFFAPNDSPEA